MDLFLARDWPNEPAVPQSHQYEKSLRCGQKSCTLYLQNVFSGKKDGTNKDMGSLKNITCGKNRFFLFFPVRKVRLMALISLIALLLSCSLLTEPENKAKKGFTAKEAEQLASSKALEVLSNPFLVSIYTPEAGGGVDRNGRLTRRDKGTWIFGYYTPGLNEGLLVEVTGTRAYAFQTTIDNLQGLQEILPNYIDTPEALAKAEDNGGKQIQNTAKILCRLSGDPVWPPSNPTKVAWQITYKTRDGQRTTFYVEAYTGIFLGKK